MVVWLEALPICSNCVLSMFRDLFLDMSFFWLSNFRCAHLVDLELSKSSDFACFAGIGYLFLMWRTKIISSKPLSAEEILYFRSLSFMLYGFVYELFRILDEEYDCEDARKGRGLVFVEFLFSGNSFEPKYCQSILVERACLYFCGFSEI